MMMYYMFKARGKALALGEKIDSEIKAEKEHTGLQSLSKLFYGENALVYTIVRLNI